MSSLCITKRRQLGYLMQSADWSLLPPHERAFAESLYDDINSFARRVNDDAGDLSNKFRKLEGKLKKAIEGGLESANGGIAAVLEAHGDDDG